MKNITYRIEISELGFKRFVFPKEIKLLEYVFDDMECFGRAIFKKDIDRVMKRESDYICTGGNMCNLDIREDITIISSEFVQENMNEELSVSTYWLASLIKKWENMNEIYK